MAGIYYKREEIKKMPTADVSRRTPKTPPPASVSWQASPVDPVSRHLQEKIVGQQAFARWINDQLNLQTIFAKLKPKVDIQHRCHFWNRADWD